MANGGGPRIWIPPFCMAEASTSAKSTGPDASPSAPIGLMSWSAQALLHAALTWEPPGPVESG